MHYYFQCGCDQEVADYESITTTSSDINTVLSNIEYDSNVVRILSACRGKPEYDLFYINTLAYDFLSDIHHSDLYKGRPFEAGMTGNSEIVVPAIAKRDILCFKLFYRQFEVLAHGDQL